VRCRLEVPTLLPDRFVPSETRHNLLLVLKEALANVIKHAGATGVEVRLAFVDPELLLAISDNGRGFDPARTLPPEHGSDGLANMRRRLDTLRGTLTVASEPGQGTRISARVELPAHIPVPA
jgi:signal transduction histidine kinase